MEVKEVLIRPQLGKLNLIEGRYPHRRGLIGFKLTRAAEGGLKGSITMPEGSRGTFEWLGRSQRLKPGEQNIDL